MTQTFFNMPCRICGSRRVELFLDLGSQPHCNRLIPKEKLAAREPFYPLRVGFCHECTLVQIDTTIPKEDMFSDYPYVSGTTKTLPSHFADTSRRIIEAYKIAPGALVIDIGSNDGTWLKQYEPFKMRVLGVEPATNVAELAQLAGVPTLNRFFNEETADLIIANAGEADIVTAAGVFFHLEELHSVVRGIKKVLAPNGVFCVQAIYLGGMIENTAFDQVYHEHLCYYTLKSVSRLLGDHGLEVNNVSVVPVHGGTLELHVSHKGARAVQPTVADFAAQEKAKAFGEFETYQDFAKRTWALKDSLIGVLKDFRRRGKRVYAYGAPAKGATLLNSFGITPDLVQLAVEKNPLKIGMAIPGCRIPIVDEASVDKPDAYLMLAWNFLTEFFRKERPFLDEGGAFIVPIPDVRVITKADLDAPSTAVAAWGARV
ncbi:MAG: class I SAM-dependent methyltransferase [Alphaproteobacteria bacterium]